MTAQTGVVSYPTPAYSNVPIQPQNYQPSRFQISDITTGVTTTITTTTSMNYVIGQLVRLLIPAQFGSYQLNYVEAYVIAIPSSTQVTIDYDSRNVNAFTSSSVANQPQIIAIGNIANGQINNNGNLSNITYTPGAFINISP